MCVTQTQLTFPPSHFVFLWWIQSLLKTQNKSFCFSSCIKRNPKVRENITFCVVPSSQKRKRTNSLVISSCYRSAIAKVWRKCPACTSPGTECLPEPPRVQPALLISLQFLKSLSLFGIRPSKRTDYRGTGEQKARGRGQTGRWEDKEWSKAWRLLLCRLAWLIMGEFLENIISGENIMFERVF